LAASGFNNGILNDMWKQPWKIFSAYAPVVLWAVVIYLFSSQSSLPGFDVAMYDYVFKKGAHMTVYGVFYFLLFRAINFDKPRTSANWWLPMLLTVGYATTDEFHQIFTPKRHPSPLDIGFDMIGASIVYLRLYRYI
jgi:hypothetical protein